MISFDSNLPGFSLMNKAVYRNWIKQVIAHEAKTVGDIYYIFLSDDDLLIINQQYLNHHNYTDIITFPLSESDDTIRGEIYISIDRVQENSKLNRIVFEKELSRVIIHGVLHLLGYDDHSTEEKKIMRRKEDYYINLLP